MWTPEGKLQGVIVALHGFNDYSNFIRNSAEFFAERGLAVYSYDQRGFGNTATRGYWSGWQSMAKDLVTCIALLREKHPETPLYILGDSMGGAVTVVTVTHTDLPPVDGVILVAPALWARSAMPFYQRFALWLAAHTIPWKKVSGKSLDITPSDNIEMLRELGKDPLVIKETRIGVLHGLTNLMDRAYSSAEKFTAKSLILYGEKDEIIPREPVFDFIARLPAESQENQKVIVYENGYHMLLRDLQAEKVMSDIADWISQIK